VKAPRKPKRAYSVSHRIGTLEPGTIATLTDETPHGGAMHGKTLLPGTVVRIAWHDSSHVWVQPFRGDTIERNPTYVDRDVKVADVSPPIRLAAVQATGATDPFVNRLAMLADANGPLLKGE
jgi:hypothetical protein